MRNKIFKTTTLVLFFTICTSIIYILGLKLEPTKIIEIPNSIEYHDNPDSIVKKRYYMVINPPKSPKNLKDLMLDYCKYNKINTENPDITNYKGENTQYLCVFYKEGLGFSRTWKPDLTLHVSSPHDQIQEHLKYSLGYVSYWSKDIDMIDICVFSKTNLPSNYYKVPISFFNE